MTLHTVCNLHIFKNGFKNIIKIIIIWLILSVSPTINSSCLANYWSTSIFTPYWLYYAVKYVPATQHARYWTLDFNAKSDTWPKSVYKHPTICLSNGLSSRWCCTCTASSKTRATAEKDTYTSRRAHTVSESAEPSIIRRYIEAAGHYIKKRSSAARLKPL